MSEIGESAAVAKPVENAKKGKVKVSVRDVCTEKRIAGATVSVNRSSKETVDGEDVVFDEQDTGVANIRVSKHFKEADYVTFVVHTLVVSKSNITRSFEAKSSAVESGVVEENKETKVRVDLVVFKVVEKIIFHRRNIVWGAGDGEDKYGHWWTVVDENTSFGWWPKYPIGSRQNRQTEPPQPPAPLPSNAGIMQTIQQQFDEAVYRTKMAMYKVTESPAAQTFRGVEGELNGTAFGGTRTRDAHHVGGDQGEQQYQPVINDCREHSSIKISIVDFAGSYAGKYGSEWSWRAEGGNHCHTFQKRLMKDCNLEKVKVIK